MHRFPPWYEGWTTISGTLFCSRYEVAPSQLDRIDAEESAAALGLRKHLHNVAVGRPPTECWFRVRDGEDFAFDTYLLHIKNGADRGVYQVGATKEGVPFAGRGDTSPECVVSGGKGTIAVSYKGKTYYVCCSGCRDEFKDNPEKYIKEYEARQAREKSKE